MGGYQYGGTGKSLGAEEAARRLASGTGVPPAVRNGISPALATSREARAAVTVELTGAVKVDRFPNPCRFPFREIAADGGIWKLDPAAFPWRGKPAQPASVRAAACKYATEHGLKIKTLIDEGMIYVQFSQGGAGLVALHVSALKWRRQRRKRRREAFADPRVPSPGMGYPADGDRL